MILYPKLYLTNVKEITLELMEKYNLKGLILDVDNTLIDLDKKILDGTKQWCDNLKHNGIKIFILSNTNKVDKVKAVADELELDFINFAKKPTKSGFKKAQKIMEIKPEEIAVVGDQIFTDVFGGNRMKMFTILTKPLDSRDIFITRLKRPIERIVINSYVKNITKEK